MRPPSELVIAELVICLCPSRWIAVMGKGRHRGRRGEVMPSGCKVSGAPGRYGSGTPEPVESPHNTSVLDSADGFENSDPRRIQHYMSISE